MKRHFLLLFCTMPCRTQNTAQHNPVPRRAAHHTSIISLIPTHSGLGGKGCSEPAGECVSNPCDAAGTNVCAEQVSGFKCVCRHGYTGRLCKTPISNCVQGLCQHGSKCVDLRGGFMCECLPGKEPPLTPPPTPCAYDVEDRSCLSLN